MIEQVCRYILAIMLAVLVMANTSQCHRDTGDQVGSHDGPCKTVGEVQTRSDGSTWRCGRGYPGDYPRNDWVRTK